MIGRLATVLALLVAAPGAVALEALRVVTTSADLKSLVEEVGGDRVTVESLAAPEQDPHTLELKPAQLARISRAQLLVRVGLDHEPWLARVRVGPATQVLDASRHARLLQTQTPRLRAEKRAHVHAFGNTHYWLDPDNARAVAAAVATALASLQGDAAYFERRQADFARRLQARSAEWQRLLAPHRGARLVVMHDSWAYLAERFGLRIVGAVEPQPGVPPSPAELAELFQRMREADVRVLVADPHSNPSLVRQVVERTGARAVTLQPSGPDYLRLMDGNVERLARALGGA